MATPTDGFIQETARKSSFLGLRSVIILVRDPVNGEIKGYNTKGAWQDMGPFVTDKLGLAEAALRASEASWPED